jgi:hypothetical protein
VTRLRDLALGIVLVRALDRVRRGRSRGADTTAAPAAPGRPGPRTPLLAFTLGAFVAGAVLMFVFEAAVTRVLGVAALFAFVVAGVFLIADPRWLAADDGSG